ncbi:hypothetical protein M5689_022067 [Euphorbia peplus]|nr:hypothetical protein M5689_022067 [Euphorbia peplus]
MAVSSSSSSSRQLIQVPTKFKDSETSPPYRTTTSKLSLPNSKTPPLKKVAVVYYLSRNGQLEHPHFIEVHLSSPEGLYLRDVISRLNILRGKSMASLYSWSSKRSYKNGFVWHDLADNDFIYPAHGHEYVLKGSELLEPSINLSKPTLLETASSPKPSETHKSTSSEDSDFQVVTRRRNQSWSSIDLNEYKVYKAEPFSESSRNLAADASTQTDDKRRRRRPVKEVEELQEKREEIEVEIEISPPPSDSSPETLESLMKADGRLILGSNEDGLNRTVENCGRLKASTVLMQLISCGSMSFKDCGATAVKEQGFSLIGQYKARLPRGVGTPKEFPSFSRVRLEDKEYFSGSLIETKKEQVPALKRSNSYNADRSMQMGEKEEEGDGARTRCIPRKSRGLGSKRESTISLSSNNNQVGGSKRFEAQHPQNDAV